MITWIRRHRWFGIFVILPTLIAAVYYLFIASDQYVSESRFVIKSPGQRQIPSSALSSLIQSTGLTSGQEQAKEVLDYLQSRSALVDLQKRIDVRAKYTVSSADTLSRFPKLWTSGGFEDLYKYYIAMARGRMDAETSSVVLETHAFTAKDAHDINAELLALSERLINRLNNRAQDKAIAENQRRVDIAEDRVRRARGALGNYRNAQALFDPAKQALGVLDVTNKLIGEQTSLKAQLDLMNRVAPANPSIPALRTRIGAIDAQIAAQSGRAVGTSGGIASKVGGYENLAVEQEFATNTLTAANASLEQARVEAQKQQFYLERVVEPNLPDQPLLPHRLRQILTIAAASLALYFIGWMIVIGILEHAPED